MWIISSVFHWWWQAKDIQMNCSRSSSSNRWQWWRESNIRAKQCACSMVFALFNYKIRRHANKISVNITPRWMVYLQNDWHSTLLHWSKSIMIISFTALLFIPYASCHEATSRAITFICTLRMILVFARIFFSRISLWPGDARKRLHIQHLNKCLLNMGRSPVAAECPIHSWMRNVASCFMYIIFCAFRLEYHFNDIHDERERERQS